MLELTGSKVAETAMRGSTEETAVGGRASLRTRRRLDDTLETDTHHHRARDLTGAVPPLENAETPPANCSHLAT